MLVYCIIIRLLSNKKKTRKENQPGMGQVLFLFPFFGERKKEKNDTTTNKNNKMWPELIWVVFSKDF